MITTKEGSGISLSKFLTLFISDFFLVLVLISGFIEQGSFVTSPLREIPGECRQLFLAPAPEGGSRLARVADLVPADMSYQTQYEVYTDLRLSEICKPGVSKLVAVQENSDLKSQVDTWLGVKEKLKLAEVEVSLVESSYKEILAAEKTKANPKKLTTDQKAVKEKYHTWMKLRNVLFIQLRSIELNVEQYPEIIDLYKTIQLDADSRSSFVESIHTAEIFYPLRKIASQLMFAFPLLLFSLIGLAFGRKKRVPFFELLCYHILFISLSVIMAFSVYFLIQPLLAVGLEIVRSILVVNGLSFLWSYLILVVLLLSVFLVERIMSGALWRNSVLLPSLVKTGRCTKCELKVPDEAVYCPHCGEKLFKNCSHCGHSIHRKSTFCSDCGKPC